MVKLHENNLRKVAVFGLKGVPAIGGTASVGENIVKELANQYNFTIYATSSHASKKNPINNVRQYVFKKFLPHKLNVFYYNLMSAFHAVFFCNYDLVHTHQIDTAFILPILRLRYKVISTHHGRTYKMSKWGLIMRQFFRFNEWLMMKLANQVTFVAKTEQEDAEIKYGGSYVTIPNGINLDEEVETECAYSDYILFAAGRIIPHKGCHVFLEALKQINYPGKILIVGDHHQMPDYKAQLEAYKSVLDVEFLGMIKEKPKLLSIVGNAKLFVFPSFYEAMSIMLLEAVLVKVPIICSDIKENTYIFDDDEITFFKVGDVNGLCKEVNRFLDNPGLYKSKSDKAYRKLGENYSWSKIRLLYAKEYGALIW
ncbi:glycosyltransferase family 4 protein [Carboxylicivirga sp. N1Y90]|uniref:glycosyltransferase family 4 protein n=1 Tax=Carboxylicivirga fragile TaxID=3417571 RepID=UPI003D34C854|nr:glycosyltransferase family 4 protein [Marinilabiliaceae bacterium N1Y90]